MSHVLKMPGHVRGALILVALALVALLAAPAKAQMAMPIDSKTQARLQARMQEIQLLRNGTMQKELSLLPSQVDDINELVNDMQQEMMGIFQGLQNINPEDMEREMATMVKRLDSKATQLYGRVELLLDEKQKTRLKQISLQLRGASALDDPEVMEALGLTYEQKTKMEDVREDIMQKQQKMTQAMMADGGNPDINQLRTEMTTMQSDLETRLYALLTKSQKDLFQKLKGEKFNGLPPR